MMVGYSGKSFGLEQSRVMMLNGVSAVTSLSVIAFSIVYAAIGYRYFYGPLYALPIAGLVFAFNHLRRYDVARYTYVAGSMLVICYWCYEGRGNGNEYTFIGLAITSTLILRRGAIIYSVNFLCALFFLSYKYLHASLPFQPDPAINYDLVPWIILINTVAVIFFQITFFRDLAVHFDHRLSLRFSEQRILLERQRVVEEEFKASNEKLQDITEHLELIVRKKTAELQVYIEAINMNMFSTISDLDGRFVKVNKLILQVSGYREDELVGNHYSMLSSGRYSAEFFSERRAVLMAGRTWRGELEHKTREGMVLWFDCVVIPMRNIHNDIESFLTIGLPITERKINDKMREDTHRLLEDIAFRASHNIRGPLARIKGLTHLIERDWLETEEFQLAAERLTACSDELNLATSELVSFVHSHQQLIEVSVRKVEMRV